ncbi:MULTISPECIES: hypothetical protein [Caballeronia]|uniref:DUF4136 domain-containing protein n=2 Tax=Burkholderiaceae TaxID=119060 RepID=A0A656QQT2_9BURK|nr:MULTISPECIES: hypothetical protein [Caballeronia]KDR33864.1 hypothetical protein BG60_01535 [Caballeronia zhejiangensis]MCG7403798.1 hypothetical protein [Caballeronia zhejiangensis]MCI1044738.1 hypothetical protein [Caballeronia zhejiangensis]MDR5766869.1 hypothetical protein [Caballeronia sp. LZ028]MDR5788735.1 hypothetical protein [Caballeronia sp. LP003]
MFGTLIARALLAFGASALSGCTWTLITAADAAGSLVQAGMTVASNYSSPTSVTGSPASLQSVCIELNQNVATGDFVPSLQVALQRRGVISTVYNPGTSPPGCEAMFVYAATTSWNKRAFGSEPVPYLSAIDLTIVRQGQILVTARYDTNGLNVDRFASARQKLDALVDRMVVSRTQ